MRTTLSALLAGSSLLALSSAASVQAAEADQLLSSCDSASACATVALEGLIGGFTGAAGSDLWGWLIGGGQSAGTNAIASDLKSIQSTLQVMETEIAALEIELQALECGLDINFLNTYAAPIQSYYTSYSDWLTGMQNGSLPKIAEVENWADCAVGNSGQTCQNDDIQTLLIAVNNAATGTAGAGGSISDCLNANSEEPPALGTLDDRPFYSNAVEPITGWYLALNTQAMTVLTEAYHFQAWQAAGSPSSGSTAEIYENVCSTSNGSSDCVQPIVKYNSDFTVYTKDQLKIGGAPYSTDDHVLMNGLLDGTWYLLARSIETYNAAAKSDCGDPSTTLCGPTIGPPNFTTMESVEVGPYDFGNEAKGTGIWEPGSLSVFDSILNGRFDGAGDVTLGEYLCTVGVVGGDPTTCTQPNGGAGLKNVSGKGFYLPEKRSTTLFNGVNEFPVGPFQCFLDGNLPANITDGQPICNSARFKNLLRTSQNSSKCIEFAPVYISEVKDVTPSTMGIFPEFYKARQCPQISDSWKTRPGYLPNPLKYPESWHWPVLDLATIKCPGAMPDQTTAGNDNVNAYGVPTLCGDAFDTWFETQVPPGPTTTTATADATLGRADPNTNNGADPRLQLAGSKHRAVIAFDLEVLEMFLDDEGLERAQLVVSSADRSSGKGHAWLQALPLEGTFAEGDGNRREDARGSGEGTTWNCATDAEIADFAKECATEWPRRFGQGDGPRVRVPDGYSGKVTFDVTEDVKNGVSAWVIKYLRGGASVAFHSSQGAEQAGDPSLAPTLILTGDGEDQMAAADAD